MRAPTARVVLAPSAFWTGHRLRRLRPSEIACVCEGCDWYIIRPEGRFDSDHMDALRAQHLEKAHRNDLISGRMAWRLPREGAAGLMPLLNYTTEVPVSRTIGHVQSALVEGGARQILSEYDSVGTPIGVAFTIGTAYGPRQYRLPVNTAAVEAVLRREKIAPRYKMPQQAERVAWRILKDWLEAQLALIRTQMVTLDQVMLPYMLDDSGRTVYELYADHQMALPEAADQ